MVLGIILISYASARILSKFVPNPIPRLAIIALDVVSAMAFALVHGSRHYRIRGILVFTGICGCR